jgi:heat shock protein HslJ
MPRSARFLLVAVIVVAACGASGSGTSPASSDPPAALDPQGPWQLVEGQSGGQPLALIEDARITFIVEGSNVGGRSACNQYFGELTVVDGVVRIDGLGGTDMGCLGEVMDLEQAYLKALGSVTAARMDGENLVLVGPDTELRFERLEPPPTAALVGTRWVLDALVQGDAVASTIGDPAILALAADGTLAGSTGCRTFTGRYVVSGDEIDFVEFALDGECAGGPADQDAHVVEVLEGGFRASVDGQQLTLSDDGGLGLVYLVAPEG